MHPLSDWGHMRPLGEALPKALLRKPTTSLVVNVRGALLAGHADAFDEMFAALRLDAITPGLQ